MRDFGRGIPLGKVIDCVSKVNTGGKFNDDVFQFSVGLNGIGTKAVEEEFSSKFPGCDAGAMPPFGNLYGMPVYVDTSLTEDAEIAFNACTHTELIQLAYKDFQDLVKPTVAAFRQ